MMGWKRPHLGVLALACALALGCEGARTVRNLPDVISLTAGSGAVLDFALPGVAELDAGETQAAIRRKPDGLEIHAGNSGGRANLVFRWLGILPVKQVDVEVNEERVLIPGGNSIGIALETDGLVVVGTSDVGRQASPAQIAGLHAGDIITRVDGETVSEVEALTRKLRSDTPTELEVLRDGELRTLTLTPVSDAKDGTLRIGAWVRSGTAGVGTLTFVDPETHEFGALGHAIADADTGTLLPVSDGGIYESRIVQINRGRRGTPGEIVGDFLLNEAQIGTLELNTDFGIYGSDYSGSNPNTLYPQGLPVGRRGEMHVGNAQILTTIGDSVEAFDCELEHVDPDGAQKMRSIVVHITDAELIARTGGIVQGMSGSPIVQDGKLVGAVTHVFVGDPTRGYGVGIETMLDEMDGMAA